jgi:hypothetical protein
MKYKHKHTGQIVTKGTDGLFHSKEGGYTLQRWIFENSNDWEEVKEEPNYLITAFTMKGTGAHRPINADGTYGYTFPFITLKEMLEEGHDIYSVKNSKGEEFTIGDNVFYLPKQTIELFKIDNFFINRDGMLLARSSQESSAICEDINTIAKEIKVPYKPKEPLYTTTDGVDLFEGQNHNGLYLLNKDLTLPNDPSARVIYSFSLSDAEVCNRYLTFTSEENRDKYIKENSKKPIFVSADGKELFVGDYCYIPQINWNNELLGNYIEMKVESSLIIGNKVFSSRELAQEYIDNNKPKYSFTDIKHTYDSTMVVGNINGFMQELKKLGK